jgi:hypothetical protein
MTKISFAAADWGFGASKAAVYGRPQFNQDAFSRRIDRFGARRDDGRTGAITSSPQHLDARLLEDGEALEAAWQCELRALIASRRLKTPETEATARAAQTACATIARRIETSRALTLDGLKVQARAALWRRDGEPFGPDVSDGQAGDDAWTDMAELPQYDENAMAAPPQAASLG